MCGIAGFIETNPKTKLGQLQKMARSLAHRGPDDEGFYLKNGVGLGFQRLSIIDLSKAGHQPMTNEKKNIWLVFNGEIYNYQELRTKLEKLGHKFKSRTDTEVIIHAYEQWGKQCLKYFNGMFAFAIWDEKEKKLFAARDRIGIKPFYYYFDGNNFIFGSELKSIINYPDFKKELDKESLYQYLYFQYVPSPRSIYKNTHKLLPGHYLIFKNGQTEVNKWWEALNFKSKEISEIEALEKLEKLLISSVKYRLIADVPVGCFLSGGTDSSLVSAIAQRLAPGKLKTFTIGFWDKKYNEAQYAKKVAKYLGTDHTELYLKPKDVIEAISKMPEFYDEPFSDPSQLPTYLVSKLARKKVKVVLSGDGGDELFCGYDRYEFMEKRKFVLAIPQWLKTLMIIILENSHTEYCHKVAYALQNSDLPNLYQYTIGIFRPRSIRNLLGFKPDFSKTIFCQTLTKTNEMPLLSRLMLTDLKNYLPDDILAKVDRASMATSLEARIPLLDYRVVQFILSLPLEYKYKNGERKYLLKRILYQYFPKEFFDRPKQGFGVPLADWFRERLKYLLNEYLSPKKICKQGLFNEQEVSRLVKTHLSGHYDNYHLLWTLIMFEMWYDEYMR